MQTEAETENYKWLTPHFYSKAYDQFIKLYWATESDPVSGHIFSDLHLNPNDFRLSVKKEHSAFWCHDFIRLSTMHLVGQINGFRSDIQKLKSWEKILSQYDSQSQKIHLIDEFIEPLVTSCLIAPFALKNQIFFTGTQTAILLNRNRSLKIPENHQIDKRTFEEWVGAWQGFSILATALAELADKEFNDLFRNRYTHRLPPRIEIGITPNYRFAREGQLLKISGGNEPPLPLAKAIEESVIQHRACVTTFRAFWIMLKNKLSEM